MRHIERYVKHVETVEADQPVAEAADRMRLTGVGSLVVLARDGLPVGLVTDRDLALRVVADGRDPDELTVSAVMSQPLIEVTPQDPLERVVGVMREHGVRRVPVVDEKRVIGLVSIDDLIVALTEELEGIASAARREVLGSQRVARMQDVRHELEDGLSEMIGHVERIGDRTLEGAVKELEGMVTRVRNLFR